MGADTTNRTNSRLSHQTQGDRQRNGPGGSRYAQKRKSGQWQAIWLLACCRVSQEILNLHSHRGRTSVVLRLLHATTKIVRLCGTGRLADGPCTRMVCIISCRSHVTDSLEAACSRPAVLSANAARAASAPIFAPSVRCILHKADLLVLLPIYLVITFSRENSSNSCQD